MSLRSLASTAFGTMAFATFSAAPALALPLGQAGEMAHAAPDSVFAEMTASGVDFSGTVALNNCSGSLVRLSKSQPKDRALILTNGHCYEGGFPSPGQVITNTPSSRTFDLLNADASDTLATLTAESVVYSTMTDTDMTLYRLTQTYEEIAAQTGIQPLTIADKQASPGASIRVVSGFWRHIYSCSIDTFVYELHEGAWIFKDPMRYTATGCEVIGGTSGSPVIQADTHEVVGVNNTINENGERCTDNNPCEVGKDGAVNVIKGVGYAEELFNIYTCLTPTNELDLTVPGCALPKPQ